MKPPSLNVPSSLMKACRLWDYRPSAKTRLQLLDAFLDDVNGLQALHRAFKPLLRKHGRLDK